MEQQILHGLIAFENQSSQIIDYYTYVLKSTYMLGKISFRTDARGNEIDAFRKSFVGTRYGL